MHVRLKGRNTNAALISYLEKIVDGAYLPENPNDVLIVGISNRDYLPGTNSWRVTNRFDDWLVHVWRDEHNMLQTRWCPATCEPGATAVAAGQTGSYNGRAVNRNGAGCLTYGYHEKIWYPHLHNWKYPALCMNKFTLIQRNQGPASLASKAIFVPGVAALNNSYSFNCHYTKKSRRREGLSKKEIIKMMYERVVNNWGHGCAVHLYADDLEHLMALVDKMPKYKFYSNRESKEVMSSEVSYYMIPGDAIFNEANNDSINSDVNELRKIRDAQAFVTKAHNIAPRSSLDLANACDPVSGRSFGDIAFYGSELHPMFVVSFNRVIGYDNGQWLDCSINYRDDLLVVGRLK